MSIKSIVFRHISIRSLACIFLCLGFCTTASAYNHVYRTIDLHDGLASMFVLTLHQDADGIIWAGTYNGLSLLGGNNSEVIFPQHPHIKALAGSIVENIQSTDDGMLWIQNNFGMHLWNRVTGELEHHPEAQGGNRCAVSSKGDVVVFTSRRGFLFYNHVAHLFQPLSIEEASYSDCRHLSLDSLGRLTLYTSVERMTYQLGTPAADGTVTAQLLSREGHPMGRIHYALSSGSDFFYIDVEHRVHIANSEGLEAHYCFTLSPEQRQMGSISSVVRDGQDLLLSFKTSGIIRMHYQPDGTYVDEPQFFTCGVFWMMKDSRQDILWVATDGEGIRYSVRTPHQIRNELFSQLPFAVSKPVRALLRDSNDDLWIGTKGDGLLCYAKYGLTGEQKHEVRQFKSQNSALLHNSIYCLTPSSHGIFWIGSDGNGLNYYNPVTHQLGTLSVDDSDMARVHALIEIEGKVLYAATGLGVYRIKLTWHGDTPVATDVHRLIYDRQKDYTNFISVSCRGRFLWFACRNNGVVRYDLKTGKYAIVRFSPDVLTATNDAICVDASRPGVVYCGTSTNVFQMTAPFDGEKIAFADLSRRLEQQGHVIRALTVTPSDTLWAATSDAIFCMDMRSLNYEIYSAENGLSTMEFGEGACYYDERYGTTFFGATDGFVAVSSQNIQKSDFMPPVLFYDVHVGDCHYSIKSKAEKGEMVRLPYNQNYFTVGYTAVDYAEANEYAFEYRLNGQAWMDNGHSRVVSFVDVKPGRYVLQVRYRKGTQVSPAYTLYLRVTPPWWASLPAHIVYILLIMYLIALMVRQGIRRQRRRREREAEEVEKRHREELYTSRLQFFIDLTHEFSTPLMLIEGPVQRILNMKGLDENVRHFGTLIQDSSRKMKALIQQVIDFRSYETGRLLPLEQPDGKATAMPQPPIQLDANKPVLFMADESHDVLSLLADVLKADFNVFCFDNAETMMSKMVLSRPDIVVAETVMQPIDGLELCRRMKGDTSMAHIPVVLLSTDFDPQKRTASATAGADAFLTKPFDLDYFLSVVKGLVQKRSQLKEYFNSSLSAFELHDGRLLHEEDRAFINSMTAIISDNISNSDLSAAFVAKQMGVGLRSLYRRMQEITSETPTTLIRDLRLERARQLLTKTELSMEEVCYSAGFNNRGTFYKQFVSKFGCTPGQYHEKMLSEAKRSATDNTFEDRR